MDHLHEVHQLVLSNALRYHMKFDSEMSSMSGAECNEAKGIE